MDSDVIIVGAGTTGLTLANLLAAAGIRSAVYEAKAAPDTRMRAIGVTPPTLEILDRFGIGGPLVQRGVAVRRAEVYGDRRLLGSVSFDGIHSRYPFILSVPQTRIEHLLRSAAEANNLVRVHYGAEVVSVEPGATPSRADDNLRTGDSGLEPRPVVRPTGITVRFRDGRSVNGLYACICSGASGFRPFPVMRRRRYRRLFLIGDYPDTGRLGDIARLYFSRDGSVESFPLPAGMRRWIVQLTGRASRTVLDEATVSAMLTTYVNRRTGIRLPAGLPHWWSSFRPERHELAHFARFGMFAAGDVAHSMSPIGGQGMNTGIADAELAADLIAGRTMTPESPAVTSHTPMIDMVSGTRLYEKVRRKAGRSASRRAAASMFVGTVGGVPGSAIRNALLRAALTLIPDRAIASHFAMLTIPGHRSPLSFTARTISSRPQ